MLRKSLPREQWPAADQAAWEAACRPSVRLLRGGAASHLKLVSQQDLERQFGIFLDFLKRNQRLDANQPAAGHVTPENVEAYLQEAKSLVSSVTVYNSIRKLRRAAQLLAPGLDLTWLIEIEKDLALVMVPRSKYDRLVLTGVLIDAGLTLVEEAKCSSMSSLKRARQHRNGLMIAMLAHHPIRLKNFAALEIGRSLLQIKGTWWIVLSATETKEGKPDERPVDPSILPALEAYLRIHRPILSRASDQSSALWVASHDGRAMSYSAVEKTISQTTRMMVGIDVSPHLFRTSIASTAAILSGEHPELGSALLHHSDIRVREQHYNRASCLSAGQAYLKVITRYRSH
jgi:integrase